MNGQYTQMNRTAWDRRTELHFDSEFYDVSGFLAGKTSLREIELAELGSVQGRRLLHVQCHFGLDTLSWARRGAICTGVDFSLVSIEKARELNEQAGLDVRFVCSDVYQYKRGLELPFDIVFASYGVICWLPDLTHWAEVVASNLVAGGTFYLAEFHPVHDHVTGFGYFEAETPDIEVAGTYTENGAKARDKMATWAHPVSSVVNALINAGIEVLRMNEYPFSPYNCFSDLVEREPGRYFHAHQGQDTPMVFTLTGKKTA